MASKASKTSVYYVSHGDASGECTHKHSTIEEAHKCKRAREASDNPMDFYYVHRVRTVTYS